LTLISKKRYNHDRAAFARDNEPTFKEKNREVLEKFGEICGFDYFKDIDGKSISWSLKAAADGFHMAKNEGIDTSMVSNKVVNGTEVVDKIISLAGQLTNVNRFGNDEKIVYWTGSFLEKALFSNLRDPKNKKKELFEIPGTKAKKSQPWADTPDEFFHRNKFLLFLNHRELVVASSNILGLEELTKGAPPSGSVVLWELHEEDDGSGDQYIETYFWKPSTPSFEKKHEYWKKHKDVFDLYGYGSVEQLRPTVCKNPLKCKLEEFEEAYKKITDKVGDWKQVCGMKKEKSVTSYDEKMMQMMAESEAFSDSRENLMEKSSDGEQLSNSKGKISMEHYAHDGEADADDGDDDDGWRRAFEKKVFSWWDDAEIKEHKLKEKISDKLEIPRGVVLAASASTEDKQANDLLGKLKEEASKVKIDSKTKEEIGDVIAKAKEEAGKAKLDPITKAEVHDWSGKLKDESKLLGAEGQEETKDLLGKLKEAVRKLNLGSKAEEVEGDLYAKLKETDNKTKLDSKTQGEVTDFVEKIKHWLHIGLSQEAASKTKLDSKTQGEVTDIVEKIKHLLHIGLSEEAASKTKLDSKKQGEVTDIVEKIKDWLHIGLFQEAASKTKLDSKTQGEVTDIVEKIKHLLHIGLSQEAASKTSKLESKTQGEVTDIFEKIKHWLHIGLSQEAASKTKLDSKTQGEVTDFVEKIKHWLHIGLFSGFIGCVCGVLSFNYMKQQNRAPPIGNYYESLI